MTEPPAVLAADVGNSKTDVALVAADGTVVARERGPGAGSVDDAVRVLDEVVARLRAATGLDGHVAAHTSACVAHLDRPADEERFTAAVRARGWSATTDAANDTFAVLRAGVLAGGYGAAVVCGAGMNCVGVGPDGRVARFLAIGDLSGDWGGGPGLGRAVLWCAMRAEDGRAPDTALRPAVAGRFGLATVADIAAGIHDGALGPDPLGALAPVLFDVARGGDETARRLVTTQADEMAAMAVAALRRLGLANAAPAVVLGGGVVTANAAVLLPRVTEVVRATVPAAVVGVIDVAPVAGAALRGLDHVGAGADAERRLRDALRPTSGW